MWTTRFTEDEVLCGPSLVLHLCWQCPCVSFITRIPTSRSLLARRSSFLLLPYGHPPSREAVLLLFASGFLVCLFVAGAPLFFKRRSLRRPLSFVDSVKVEVLGCRGSFPPFVPRSRVLLTLSYAGFYVYLTLFPCSSDSAGE